MSHRHLKLIGDGTAFGTELIDAETGENLFSKYAVEIVRVEVDSVTGGPAVWLKLWPALVDLALTTATAAEQTFDICNPGLGKTDRADRAIPKIPPLSEGHGGV